MDNSTTGQKSFVDRIWDFFASIKLAAAVFGLIALTSIIGTVLEQQAEPEKNLKLIAKAVGPDMAPGVFNFFHMLGFFDMYHSWWFVLFLVVFSANLIICSLDRLPAILRSMRQPLEPLTADRFGAYPIRKEFKVKQSPGTIRDTLRKAVAKAGFTVHESSEGGTVQFYAQSGGYSRLGVYVTHLSILVILLGAVIGLFFGFNGFLNLPEGYTADVAYSRKGGEPVPLGFAIKLDDFDVEYYRESDMPKDYASWLKVIKDGRVVKEQRIVVNTPLQFEGFTFYQSSYGLMPDPKGVFIFNVAARGGSPKRIEVEPGGSFVIPGTSITGRIVDFNHALAFREDGSTFSYSEVMTNPAVLIKFSDKGKDLFAGWILKRFPRTWDLPDGSRVEFVDFWGAQYTGLQVRKDPGVWIVYLGCLIMGVGLYSAFFMSHRKIWVALSPDGKGGSKVVIAATANKNRGGFETRIDRIAGHLGAGE